MTLRSARILARQAVAEVLALGRPQSAAPPTLTVLMYHAVTPRSLDDPYQMSISAALFESHMASVHASAVDVLPLETAVLTLTSGRLTRPAVAVTFDDGYVGVHDHAAETLRRYQIPWTLFATADAIGRDRFAGSPPDLGRPLTWAEIATLRRESGCVVGSHTMTHPVLASLDAAAMRIELRRSSETIAEQTGERPRTFAYPYGSFGTFSAATRQALIEEAYSVGCTTVWRRCTEDDDALAVPRVRVSWCDTPREVGKAIAGCYDWISWGQRWFAR